jgi:hypothetical protein
MAPVARALAILALLGTLGSARGEGPEVAAPVAPAVFAGDVRALPTVPPWQAGAAVREGPVRRRTSAAAPLSGRAPRQTGRDPLLATQAGAATAAPRQFTPPELDFGGQGFTGVVPPDPIGDVGPHHYIQLVNTASGSAFVVLNKADGSHVAGPSLVSTLGNGTGPCASGFGDGIVLFDALASRWLMAEFAELGDHLCVYVSKTSDPLAGGWFSYAFTTPEFPDYPKYAVWPDAYYVTTNESAPAVYALDRARMLAGLPASYLRFTASPLAGFGFQALTPGDLDGPSPPPAGAPALFVRHRDDEIHDPGTNDPAHDFLDLFELHADFAMPGNSTFTQVASIPVAEFDSELCSASPVPSCFPQPLGALPLDPIAEVVMWRLQYRNFGAHETLVGNFVTDVDGTDHGGIRWFELRRIGAGAWSLFQEGTWAIDASDRWLGSVAMDGAGNMALGYSVTSPTVLPAIRYTGRLATDAAGTMTVPESTIAAGAGVQNSERWGDYSSMNVDPVDDCTFWYTNEYVAADGGWRTRVARLRFSSPSCVDAPAPVCGNGVRDVGEDCDGSDAPFCAGLCFPDCTCPAPVCGNDIAELGEECDGTSAAGCPSGVCRPDCTCALCPPSPASGCRAAGKATVAIADQPDDTRDSLRWSWKNGAATSVADFADPVQGSATYALCVYDGSPASQPLFEAHVASGGTCGTRACWKRAGSSGFAYGDKTGAVRGITKIKLKAGVAGKAQAQLTARGPILAPPNPPLTAPVTVQLRIGAICFDTSFSAPRQNDDFIFRAISP